MSGQINEAYLNVLILDNNKDNIDNSTISEGEENEKSDSDVFTVNIQVSMVARREDGTRQAVTIGQESVILTAKQISVGHTVKVNVTRSVDEWFEMPRENLGLIVRAQVAESGKRIYLPEIKDGSNISPPFLELYTSSPSRHRRKRSIGLNCEENSQETRCCRFPLTVDFEEFGWDWIIAPKRYEANYCAGDCPYAFIQKYPHTHVFTLAAKGSHGPCCAPRKMAPISMLYFDNDLNIIYGTLPAMVVERCGCS